MAGVRALFARRTHDRELDEELNSYLENSVQEKIRAGMDMAEALRLFRAEMGSLDAERASP